MRPAGADFSAAFRARHEALRGGPLPPFAAESLAEARKAAADGSHRGVALPAEAARSLGLAARLVTQPFAANGAVEEAVARAAAGLGGLVGSVRGKLVCVLDFQYHVRQRTALAHVVMQPHSSFQFSFTLTPAGTISSAVMTPLEKMALEHLGCMYGVRVRAQARLRGAASLSLVPRGPGPRSLPEGRTQTRCASAPTSWRSASGRSCHSGGAKGGP